MPRHRETWPPEAQDDWEERAAIIEFEGNEARAHADVLAEHCVRVSWTVATLQRLFPRRMP